MDLRSPECGVQELGRRASLNIFKWCSGQFWQTQPAPIPSGRAKPPRVLQMPSTSAFSVLAPAVPCLDSSYLLNLTLSLQAPCECPGPSWASSEALCRRGSVDLGHWTCIGPPWMVLSLRAAGAERTPPQRAPSTGLTSEYRCEPLGLSTWTLSSGKRTLAPLCR